ncbi:MAG: glycosyltransferase family 4 protein [Pseudomonadota bacterium]|nr:glycosyltransferase family 4 protein [Pseudomonadota bacterium]
MSETFIAQEIRGLEERGLDVEIVSLRHPTESRTHPVHEEIEAPVRYLPEYLYQEPLRVWVAWRSMRKLPAYREAWRTWLRDLFRDRTPNRIRRFGQALVLAHELAPDIEHIHAHFLHTPASVARYAAALTGKAWTVSAHAKDIWTTPEWEKREKLAAASWLVTCSGYARDHLAALDNGTGKVELVYHGLDADRFPPAPSRRAQRDGSDPDDPLHLLCVGRAVEKKGHDILLDAVAGLPQYINWRLWHVGGGELCDRLKLRAKRLGISDRVVWFGALPQGEVRDLYRKADLFVLASRIGNDGDRDGLPNVLMEAQSQSLACVATGVSAIPELIIDGETGVLVPAEDPDALRKAIAALAVNFERRLFLGCAGEARVRSAFSFRAGIDRLAAKLGAAVTISGRDAA